MQSAQDFRTRHQAYLDNLQKDAVGTIKENWKNKGDIEKQVTDLRRIVMDVSRTADLTHEMIAEKSDPAMAGLEAACSPSRRRN